MLVGIAVDRVVEEVGSDAAVVEQRVALPRRAVADDLLAVAAQRDQELEKSVLRLLDVAREALVALRVTEPLRSSCARSSATAGDGSRPSDA